MKKLKVVFVYFLDYLSEKKGLSQYTINSYRYGLIKYINFLKQNEVYSFSQVNKESINDYKSYLRKAGFSIKSIRANLLAIKTFYHFMLLEGYIEQDIASRIELPQPNGKFLRHDILSLEEIDRLLNASNFKGRLGQRDWAILGLFYATGLRALELMNLNIDDLDMENQKIKCLGKGFKGRTIPFGDACHSLDLYLEKVRPGLVKNPKEDALFLSIRGRISREFIVHLMQKYAHIAGIKKEVSSHIFRRTFATNLLESGMDLRSIQVMMGHPKVSYTRAYLHINKYQTKIRRMVRREDKLKSPGTDEKVGIRLFCKDCISFKECEGKRWEECGYRNELLKVT